MKPPADILLEQPGRLAARLRAAGAAADRPRPLCRPAGGDGGGGEHRRRQGRRRARDGGLRAAARRSSSPPRRRRPTRRGSTTTSATSASTPMSATSRRPRRRSRAPRMWRSSTPGCSASPACRSTRAPRSASTIRPTNKYTLHAGSGGVVRQKARACRRSSACRRQIVRVECGDVGGNFGTRNAFFPEFALVVWAAKRLGRPVKWTCERSEAFLSDYQGRDQVDPGRAGARRARAASWRCAARSSATPARTRVMFVPLVKCSRAAHLGLSRAGGALPRPRGA